MKKRNVRFSGFMAAILLSAGAANAATLVTTDYGNRTYATKEALDQKADKTYVDEQVDGLDGRIEQIVSEGVGADLENYLTKDDAKKTYATQESVTMGLAGKLGTGDTAARATADAAGNVITDTYATKGELDGYATDGDIAAATSDMLTKTEAGTTYATKESLAGKADASELSKYATTESLGDYLTTESAADTYATKESLAGKADTSELSKYATTAALTSGLAGKLDSNALTGYATESYVDTATADMLTKGVADETYAGIDTETVANNAATKVQQALTDIGTKSELTTENKDNLVGAINELDKAIGGMAADGTVQQIQEDLSTLTGRVGTNAAAIGTVGNLATGEKTNLVGAVNEVFGAVNDATDDLATLTERVDTNESGIGALTTTVGNAESGLVKSVNDLSASVATNTSGISDLTERVSTAESDLTKKQDVSARVSEINATAQNTQYPSALAVYNALGAKADTDDVNALETRVSSAESDIGTMESLTVSAQNLVDAINEVNEKTSGLATEGNFQAISNQVSQMQTQVNNKADKAETYTKTETDNQITTLAVPQPDDDCMAESGLCVLTITPGGQLAWTNVTAPAD